MDEIRNQFPIFQTNDKDKALVYLDSAATSQKPQAVINAITDFYTRGNSNVHRGLYPLAINATEKYIQAHKKIATMINASSDEEVIFVRNCTEGLNLLSNVLADNILQEGDVVVITEMEHHSNIIPWQLLSRKLKIKIEWIPVKHDTFTLDLDYLDFLVRKYREKVKIVSFVHMYNVLGVMNDVPAIVELASSVGAKTILDTAQSIVHTNIDVQKLGVDFITFSGHKMYGPTGIGVVWGKKEFWEKCEPWMGGGEMVNKVWKTGAEWTELPYKFEAGTPNISGGIALGVAADWIRSNIDPIEVKSYERGLVNSLLSGLASIQGIKIFGPAERDSRESIVSFTSSNVHPHDIATLLGEKNIAVRAGYHCAEPLHKNLEFGPTLRVSLAPYNNQGEIDYFLKSLKEIIQGF